MPPPSAIYVQQDAGRRHDAFGHRVERIAIACAPRVEDITGLLLPPRVVIRLVTAGEFGLACQAHRERVAATEMQELVPRTHRIRAAREQLQQQQKDDRTRSAVTAETIVAADGGTEILMIPKAVGRAGRYDDERWLHLTLARGLCHPAQQRASEGAVLHLRTTPSPQERGVAHLALAELADGHAMWAGQRACTTLLGGPPADQPTPKTSRLYRRHQARTRPATEAVDHGAEDFVTYVIGQLGTATFNRLWRRLDLAPTREELATPIQWAVRVYPLLSAEPPIRDPFSARPAPRFN